MQREKIEQQHIVTILRRVGGAVYVLGTRRRRGDHQGTMQTPGLADVWAVLPPPPLRPVVVRHVGVWIEVKAEGGRLSPFQKAFQSECAAAGVHYLTGGLKVVVAWLIASGWLKPDQVCHDKLGAAAPVPGAEGGA